MKSTELPNHDRKEDVRSLVCVLAVSMIFMGCSNLLGKGEDELLLVVRIFGEREQLKADLNDALGVIVRFSGL